VLLLPVALAGDNEPLAAGVKISITLGVDQFCTRPALGFELVPVGFEEKYTHHAESGLDD